MKRHSNSLASNLIKYAIIYTPETNWLPYPAYQKITIKKSAIPSYHKTTTTSLLKKTRETFGIDTFFLAKHKDLITKQHETQAT